MELYNTERGLDTAIAGVKRMLGYMESTDKEELLKGARMMYMDLARQFDSKLIDLEDEIERHRSANEEDREALRLLAKAIERHKGD